MISKLENRVRALLDARPALRDDDQRLVANVWWQALKTNGYDPDRLSGTGLIQMFAENKLPNPDSITRARRKLQEMHVHLRGKKYDKRQSRQSDVIDDLNLFGQ